MKENICLIVELVLHYKIVGEKKNDITTDHELSCSYGVIPIK